MENSKRNCHTAGSGYGICLITGIDTNDKELFMNVSGADFRWIQMFEKYLAVCEYSEISVAKNKYKTIAKFQPDVAKTMLEINGFSDMEIFIDMLIFYNDLRVKSG